MEIASVTGPEMNLSVLQLQKEMTTWVIAEWNLPYYLSYGYFLSNFVLQDVCLELLGKVVTFECDLIFLSKFPLIVVLV